MTDSADAENAFERSQQEMESGNVEIVDSGQVIDELDEALLQIGDTGEGEYGARMHEAGKQDSAMQQDDELHMDVSEEIIVETEETNPGLDNGGEDNGGTMEGCGNETGLYSDDEDESDLYADREIDQIIRDPITAEISLTMDLEDLVSRTITFDNGERIILCFSKRCRPQIAWNGHLYVAASDLNEFTYTRWRCVIDGCPGALRTSPGLTELRSSGHHHMATCKPDDLRVRLRIVIYDLRLMAEFTDDPLDDLYTHFVDKLAAENPDVLALFPSLEAIAKRLMKHREYKIYRRRFEYEKILAERRRSLHPTDYHNPSAVRRQRPYPPSVCIECGISMVTDSDTTSQETFVDHVSQDHQREGTCQYYSFNGVHLFEQWMRELQQRSRYKIRRFAMHNESLFFLCAADDRWCRAYGVNSDGLHCTAFVRVYDYRRVSRQEIPILRIQYCLDHNFHNDEDATVDAPFTPEIFLHEVEERRLRTAGMVKNHAQRARLLRRRPSEMAADGGAWSEDDAREDDPESHESDMYSSDAVKRPPPASRPRNDAATPVNEFGEGPDTEHDGQEERAAVADDRHADFGIESIDSAGQEVHSDEGTSASKRRKLPLQKPRFMGSRGAPQCAVGGSAKSDYDEKREVANLVEQCNRRVSESRVGRSAGPMCKEGGTGQQHYVTQRSNFPSYTLYNLVMQIELQCELFKERAQSIKQIAAAKKFLKYLTSLCDIIVTDPDCNKTNEELASEIFDVREMVNSGIVITKHTGNLPTLNFESSDESTFAQQRDGKSEPESQPLILLPVIPARSVPEELEKASVDEEEAEMDFTEQIEGSDTQEIVKQNKRSREEEETDTAFELKRSRGRGSATSVQKTELTVREPYQTRRSLGILKPNRKGVFDKTTYLGEAEANVAEGNDSANAESRQPYTLRRVPFSAESSKVKLAGRTMELSAESEELIGKPMTLKTASGNLITVMRRLDGRLVMVSPHLSPRKGSETPANEESQRELRSRSIKNVVVNKKIAKQDQSRDAEEEPKDIMIQRPRRRSVYSKYLRKDKERRDVRRTRLSSVEKLGEIETEKINPEEQEYKKDEFQEAGCSSKKGTRKQLSEDDVIVMDDETFMAVVDDMSLESPIGRGTRSESRRARAKRKNEDDALESVTTSNREEKA